MRKLLGLCVLMATTALGGYRFNLVATIPRGNGCSSGRQPAGDWDHNGYGELTFGHPIGWDIWRYVSHVRGFQLAYSDTLFGDTLADFWFRPGAAGDFDRDRLGDIAGVTTKDTGGILNPRILEVYESPSAESLPTRLVWAQLYDSIGGHAGDLLLAYDIDRDGTQELLVNEVPDGRLLCFRSTGPRSYQRFLTQLLPDWANNGYGMAIGDFGRGASAPYNRTQLILPGQDGTISDFLYTPADTFARIWQDTFWPRFGAQASDVFGSEGTTVDSVSEFFVSWLGLSGYGTADWRLDRYRSDGNGGFHRMRVDSMLKRPLSYYVPNPVGNSCCGDVDCDGLDEVLWTLGDAIVIYKSIDDSHYKRIWTYGIPSPPDLVAGASVSTYDFNRDRYPEIVISRGDATRFFEIDTTQLPGVAERGPGRFSPGLRVSPSLTRSPVQVTVSTGASPDASLAVYDGTGRQVRLLHDGGVSSGGLRLIWDGTDGQGRPVAPGVYFIRLRTGNYARCGKVVVEP